MSIQVQFSFFFFFSFLIYFVCVEKSPGVCWAHGAVAVRSKRSEGKNVFLWYTSEPPRVPQRAKSVPATEAGGSCPGLLKRGTGEPGHTKGAASARAAPASGMWNI